MIIDRAIDIVQEATKTLTIMVLEQKIGTVTPVQAKRIQQIGNQLKLLVEDSPAANQLDPPVGGVR